MVNIELNVNYRLLNLYAGTYMTCTADGSVVGQQYTDDNSQVWIFLQGTNPGTYVIQSAGSASTAAYISPENNNVAPQTPLKIYDSQFEFAVVDVTDMAAAARFVPSSNNSLYIDLYGGNSADGTVIQLFQLSGNNQVWVLVRTH